MPETPNTLQSVAIEFHAGSMTLEDVAEELRTCGFCNFIDLVYAAKVVNQNQPTKKD